MSCLASIFVAPVVLLSVSCAVGQSQRPFEIPRVALYSNELHVDANAPPTFLAPAGDDRPANVRNSVDFYLALLRAGVPAELHVYARGDHGLRGGKLGGTGGDPDTSYGKWPVQALDWMRQRGLL